MQHHPSSKDVARVAEMFNLLATKYPSGLVDLDAIDITRRGDDDHCVACHAGWVVMGTLDNPDTDLMWEDVGCPEIDLTSEIFGVARYVEDGEMARFEDGAIRISAILGFGSLNAASIDTHKIETYYGNRPWVWGNRAGSLILCDARAFGGQMGEMLTLGHLAAHWSGVETRTRQIEEEMARTGRDFDEIEREFTRISEVEVEAKAA